MHKPVGLHQTIARVATVNYFWCKYAVS